DGTALALAPPPALQRLLVEDDGRLAAGGAAGRAADAASGLALPVGLAPPRAAPAPRAPPALVVGRGTGRRAWRSFTGCRCAGCSRTAAGAACGARRTGRRPGVADPGPS